MRKMHKAGPFAKGPFIIGRQESQPRDKLTKDTGSPFWEPYSLRR